MGRHGKNMLKHKKNAMIKISPLDMPNNDYFTFIDERMKEMGIKDVDPSDAAQQNSSSLQLNKKMTNPSEHKEVQVDPEPIVTKVYIDRACSAK